MKLLIYDSGKPNVGLPPYGGSGLKCNCDLVRGCVIWSPSIRREWIEMKRLEPVVQDKKVSLHTEGVD